MVANKEYLRQRIIDAAEQLFMLQGFAATSTRQIAEKVGITQPNLYYHFPNKEEIYICVLESISQKVAGELNELALKDWSLKEKLIAMVDFLQTEHPFDFSQMFKDIHRALPRESAARLMVIWRDSFQAPFVRVLKSSELPLCEGIKEEVIVVQLFTVLSTYMMFKSPSGHSKKQIPLDQAIDLFLYGVVAR